MFATVVFQFVDPPFELAVSCNMSQQTRCTAADLVYKWAQDQ